MKEALIISVLLVVGGVVATALIMFNTTPLELDSEGLIGTLLQIWLAVAALVSAALVVTSYIHTNKAFQLTQKPQLLMQVINEVLQPPEGPEKGKRLHVTALSYKNLSSNQFEALTIRLKVVTNSAEICLDDLFTRDMFMAAGDSRTRRFRTLEELRRKGFDIQGAVNRGEEILLRPAYSFTYVGKKQRIRVQDYRWDAGRSEWQIR